MNNIDFESKYVNAVITIKDILKEYTCGSYPNCIEAGCTTLEKYQCGVYMGKKIIKDFDEWQKEKKNENKM